MSTKTSARPLKPRDGIARNRPATNIGSRSFRATPSPSRAATPSPAPELTAAKRRKCKNPECLNPNIIQQDDLSWICQECGTITEQDDNLVSEQQFTEGRGGMIMAQGQNVAHGETHARGGTARNGGHAGKEATQSFNNAKQFAKRHMLQLCQNLDIHHREVDFGLAIFTLVWKGFVRGRSLEMVATVALYLGLRGQTEQRGGVHYPKHPVMLIDFAAHLNCDVFSLGRMYVDLVRTLHPGSLGPIAGKSSLNFEHLLAHGPEVLVDRFVNALDFSEQDGKKIKNDAIRVVSRMKRDWMSTGRRPSGVCGAAIIIAARMNNHRRTTREVVLTAKVTEITINKRLEEFSELPSSQLSVDKFREEITLAAESEVMPPAWQRTHDPKPPKKRRRKAGGAAPETAAEIEQEEDEHVESAQPPAKRARIDAQGFAIPALPARPQPSTEGSENGKATEAPRPKRRGRAKGSKNWKPPEPTAAEEAIEAEIQRDIDLTLEENPDLYPPNLPTDSSPQPDPPSPKEAPTTKIRTPRTLPGPPVNGDVGNLDWVNNSPTLRPEEFEDDPDVAFCLLSESEKKLKEEIWVNQNADWLRLDHAKRIKQELQEAAWRAEGKDPAEMMRAKHQPQRRKDGILRAKRLGDVNYLDDENTRGVNDREPSVVSQDGQANPAGQDRSISPSSQSSSSSAFMGAANSVKMMMQTRKGNFNKGSRINISALSNLYQKGGVQQPSVGDGQDSEPGTPGPSEGAADVFGDDVVFGGIGTKDSGLVRSRLSIAAEKREKRKREGEARARAARDSTAEEVGDQITGAVESSLPTGQQDAAAGSARGTPGSIARSEPMQDGSTEEVVGSVRASSEESQGLIRLREPGDIADEDEVEDIEEEEDDDDESEPDIDAAFGGEL